MHICTATTPGATIPQICPCACTTMWCADELWAQLGELGIDREVPHPAFGRTAEQLKAFCTQR